MFKKSRVVKDNPVTAGGRKTPTKSFPRLTPEEIHRIIETKAYELYCSRGTNPGDKVSDWLRAEKQVRKELRLQ